MYAVMMQFRFTLQREYGQILVAPSTSGGTEILYRQSVNQRGRAGAWRYVDLEFLRKSVGNSPIVGQPIAVWMSDADADEVTAGNTPNLLVQKANRKVRNFLTDGLEVMTHVEDILSDYGIDPTGDSFADKHRKSAKAKPSAKPKAPKPTKPAKPAEATPPAPQVTAPIQPVIQPKVEPVVHTKVVEQPTVTEPVVVQSDSSAVPTVSAALLTPTLSDKDVSFYKERDNLWGSGVSETKVYDVARANERNVVLIGHAGTGKTSSARHYAANRNLPLAILECNVELTKAHIEGSWVPTGKAGELVWAESNLVTAIQQPSVVLLNELSRGLPKSMTPLFALLNERQLVLSQRQNQIVKVHPECLIIADMNPQGYAGVSKQDKALLERFNDYVTFDYDLSIDKLFCKSDTFLNEVVTKWRDASVADPTATPFSHRLTKNFQFHVEHYGLRSAVLQLLDRFDVSEREQLKTLILTNAVEIASELGVEHNDIHLSL